MTAQRLQKRTSRCSAVGGVRLARRSPWGYRSAVNAPKVEADEYIDFLIATPKACSATEAARVHPDGPRPPSHDAFTRLLPRLEPDPEALWLEAEPQVGGMMAFSSSTTRTLDKPYATAIALVTRHES